MKEKILAYMVFLTNNFSRDQVYPFVYTEKYERVEEPFEPEITKDVEAFERVCDKAAESGFNKLLIFTGDALVYDSHPEIARPGAWTKAELKRQIDRIRSLGMEPIPMLDFSAAHDIWLGEYSYEVSTEAYYRVCGDLIDELCRFFGQPSLFWLGLAEENAESQLGYDYSVVRGDKLFIHDMRFLFDACRRNGARPWISCDFFMDYPHLFEGAVEKDVLISDYRVTPFSLRRVLSGENRIKEFEALKDISRMGYDVAPMLTAWQNRNTPRLTVEALNALLDREPAGYLRCTFIPCRSSNLFKLYFEAVNTAAVLEEVKK